jgi:hypothetical protein
MTAEVGWTVATLPRATSAAKALGDEFWLTFKSH